MTPWPLIDLHIHATRYRLEGARPEMSVTNIADHLDAHGCAVAGIVEHLDSAPKHPLSCLKALVAELRTVRSRCALFAGAELDYEKDGISIVEPEVIKQRLGLDYYMAAAHGVGEGISTTQAFVEDHHRRLMGIVTACPYVEVVAHPWVEGRRFAERGLIEVWDLSIVPEEYLREFVEAAAAHGKAIEVSPKVLPEAGTPAFSAYLQLIREVGAPIAIGSDAHDLRRVGDLAAVHDLLTREGIGPEQVWYPGVRLR